MIQIPNILYAKAQYVRDFHCLVIVYDFKISEKIFNSFPVNLE